MIINYKFNLYIRFIKFWNSAKKFFLSGTTTKALKPAKKTTTLPTDNIIKQHRKIVKVKYVLFFIGNSFFSSVVRPLPPPPLLVVRPLP